MVDQLDPFGAPLEGISLIEAAAGTGKTYTITALYLRLLLERELEVEKILVVTYTNAATAELRDRIRSRLVAAREALLAGTGDDGFSQGLLNRFAASPAAEARLRQAILDFDRAAIFTIHGFCQRALSDMAFEGGFSFETELVADQQELLQEVVDDFWRTRVQDRSPGFLDYLRRRNTSPQRLALTASRWTGQPFLRIRGPEKPQPVEPMEAAFSALFHEAGERWAAARKEIMGLLIDSPGLNRNKYPARSLETWGQQMDHYFRGGPRLPAGFDKFTKFTRATLEASVKRGATPPSHPFFDTCEALESSMAAFDRCCADHYAKLLRDLVRYLDIELRRRKRKRRLLAYDDLLLNLHEALSGDGAGRLKAQIADRYSAALIDEFQDTDPLQYEIFGRIYRETPAPVFLVGDPKQAIYSFRGADIFSYLRARKNATHRYTLAVNWRSDAALVQAVNALFDQGHAPFLFPEIRFDKARPAVSEDDRTPLSGGGAALRVGMLDDGLNKTAAGEQAVSWTAGKIARLLGADGSPAARLEERPLDGSDIAVLVRSHRQGLMMSDALALFGINSVQRSQENIFLSPEAAELEQVMRAALEPARSGLVRAALATDLLGWNGNDIEALNRDDERLETQLDRFGRLHRLWRESGFIAMAGELLGKGEMAERLLQFVDGERRLTNLRHLVEILHRESSVQQTTMDGLVDWLYRRRNGSATGEEEYQLRLESDEQLVQIVTVHKSKGLQYPIVFCPFAWDGGSGVNRDGPYVFHDPADGFQAVLELGSNRAAEDRVHARREALAENLRLLYVALTRAKHRCYLNWGSVASADESALGWLLHPPESPGTVDAVERMQGRFKGLDGETMVRRLTELPEVGKGGISIEWARDSVQGESPAPQTQTGPDGPNMAARRLQRLPRTRARIASFSSLAGGLGAADQPDHDSDPRPPRPAPDPELDICAFPRGTIAGSCLHAVFEHLDFASRDLEARRRVVEQALGLFGFDSAWTPAVESMVEKVLASELAPGSGLRLANVGTGRRLVEMEFHFPVKRLDRRGLVELLIRHGMKGGAALDHALKRLQFSPVEGYLKGFIDLVFEHGGRYYLVDYKSNWLGESSEHYAPERLAEEIARHDYYLQYLLYTLGLHRYLRERIRDYAYDRHFGGAFYLFLRGMDPTGRPGAGIYRDRPAAALIEALDLFLKQEAQ